MEYYSELSKGEKGGHLSSHPCWKSVSFGLHMYLANSWRWPLQNTIISIAESNMYKVVAGASSGILDFENWLAVVEGRDDVR